MFKILSGKEKLTGDVAFSDILRSLIGGSFSILSLLLLSKWTDHLYIMAPFGASCVLLYAASQSPLAQPRNIIFGHFISAFVGLVFLKLFGISMWSIAFSVGTAIALMQFLKAVHPPAGANPLVILLTAEQIQYGWDFLVFPVLLGSLILVSIAMVVNNFKTKHHWPLYGLGLIKTKSDE